MSLEITGKLLVKYDTQVVSERFKKREFVLELTDDGPSGTYTNYAKMQLVQNKTDIIDRFNEGDTIKVSFNIKGSRYDKNGTTNYFTNLDAWRIEAAAESGGGQPAAQGYGNNGGYNGRSGGADAGNAPAPFSGNYNPSPETSDDLPF